MNQNFKPRRKKEVNINTNFSMFNKGRSGSDKGILIEKTEPVGVIESDGSGEFHICDRFALNPGQTKTFPILSQEAKVYEKYMFEELEFFTVPLVSEYALGGQQGEVSLAVNYNPALPPPASQTAALSLKPYDANLPCLPLKVRCARPDLTQTTAMFVRTGGLPGNADIKTYDVGNLYVTCEGLYETPFNINRLFVKYKCRLFNRVVLTDQGAPQNMSCTYVGQGAGQQATKAADTLMLYPQVTCNGLNFTGMDTGSLIVPGSGNYMIDVSAFTYRPNNGQPTTDDIHVFRSTLSVNGQTIYPNVNINMWSGTQSFLSLTGGFSNCLALKEGDQIRVNNYVDWHAGPTTNVITGAFVRITSV